MGGMGAMTNLVDAALERAQKAQQAARERTRAGQDLADSWNAQYPPGTSIEYLPPHGVTVDDRRCGRTRSKAVVRDGVAQVMVEGCDVLVDLSSVVPYQLGPNDSAEVDEFTRAVEAAAGLRISLEMDVPLAWTLIGAVQLACRHPLMGEHVADVLRDLARDLQSQFPEPLASLVDRGWDPLYDAGAIEVPEWAVSDDTVGLVDGEEELLA